MERETLWIISELFPPEETSTGYIMGEIAVALTQKYNVKVICGPKVYDDKKIMVGDEAIDKIIQIFRVPAVKENKGSKLSRIKKFVMMSWRLYRTAKKQIKRGERVLMVSNPFPLIVLMGYLKRSRAFNLSLLVHDVFPEGLYTEIQIPSWIYSFAETVFNRAYSSVDTLISIGRDMKDIMYAKCCESAKPPKIVAIENWGDITTIKPRESNNSGYIRIQYAGNIGNSQGLNDFVELFHDAANPNVHLDIWGTGSAEESLKQRVAELNCSSHIHFHGPYTRKEQDQVLNDADIALIVLVKGMYGLGVPSKSYNIMAAGKPIFYIGDRGSEIWLTIQDNAIGYCFEPDDKNGIISFIRSLSLDQLPSLVMKGKIARKVVERKYSKEIILNKFLDVI